MKAPPANNNNNGGRGSLPTSPLLPLPPLPSSPPRQPGTRIHRRGPRFSLRFPCPRCFVFLCFYSCTVPYTKALIVNSSARRMAGEVGMEAATPSPSLSVNDHRRGERKGRERTGKGVEKRGGGGRSKGGGGGRLVWRRRRRRGKVFLLRLLLPRKEEDKRNRPSAPPPPPRRLLSPWRLHPTNQPKFPRWMMKVGDVE